MITPLAVVAALLIAAGAGASSDTAPAKQPTAANGDDSQVSVVEKLYLKQMYEAADVVLGLALKSPQTSPPDRVQLHILEGLLRMESFQEPQARKAFTDALTADPDAKLPDFAPPAARTLFLDLKATLPAAVRMPVNVVQQPVETHRRERHVAGPYDAYWPWLPVAAGGAALLTGGGFVAASRVADHALLTSSPSINSAALLSSTVSNGETYQTTGYILVGVGGAVMIGGLIWALGPEVMPAFTLGVAPTNHGFAAMASWRLP